jgi:hypothetical protein
VGSPQENQDGAGEKDELNKPVLLTKTFVYFTGVISNYSLYEW